MTENEAKKEIGYIKDRCSNEGRYSDCEALEVAEKALKEIQAYRAIGTVEDLKSMKENGSFSGIELAQLAAMQMRLRDYQAIGTVEEFKALKEQKEKFDRINLDVRTKTIEELKNKICMHFADWQLSEKDKWIRDIIELASESVEEIAEDMKGGAE